MTGEHEHEPRAGETLYCHGVPVQRPRPDDYPLTSICGCGATIDCPAPGAPWKQRAWA